MPSLEEWTLLSKADLPVGCWDAVRVVLPSCDEAIFYDNDSGFVEVAAYRNGDLSLEGGRWPGWIVALAEQLKAAAELGENQQ